MKTSKLMAEAILRRRKLARRIVCAAISKTNLAIEQLEDRWEGSIEGSAEPYHVLMETIEMPFKQAISVEMDKVGLVSYWLESAIDVATMCNEILDQNGMSSQEAEVMALVHHVDQQPHDKSNF
jgi:hypothetical protein